jgi:hypothetical protein
MHPKGSSPGIQRPTLIRFVRKIAAADGLMRVELFQLHMNKTSGFWNTIRDTPYPKGLHGLVVEEKCHNDDFGTNHPKVRKWFLTDTGREFLSAVATNPDALPPANIKPERKLISEDARELAREEKREAMKKQKRIERWQRSLRHPKHSIEDYNEAPEPEHADVDINSPEFRYLPVLERIRILRAQSPKSEPFFIKESFTDWTPEEWAVVEAQLYPERKRKSPKSAPKPVPLPEPVPELELEPEPQQPTYVAPKPLTEDAQHKARVNEFMERLRELQKSS